tara:strand:- start:302 stop:829 length:528 start_codon:yes stop_codon:yes gene_type:complete
MTNVFKARSRSNKSKSKNKNNFFKVLEVDEKVELSKEGVFSLENENFPSLGKEMKKESVVTTFSSVLNKEQKEKKKEVNKWAGWIVMKKDGSYIVHEGGERYARVSKMLDELKEQELYNKHLNYIEKYEREKEINEYLNGPEYINSWEADEYLEKIEKNSEYDESDSDEEDYMSE